MEVSYLESPCDVNRVDNKSQKVCMLELECVVRKKKWIVEWWWQ